jgi:hypothetical protein
MGFTLFSNGTPTILFIDKNYQDLKIRILRGAKKRNIYM